MRRRTSTIATGLALLLLSAVSMAVDSREVVDQDVAKPTIRGGIVFKNYCTLCHGQRGDGMSRAAQLYQGVNLAIKPRTNEYYEKIIRGGGQVAGVSPYMPPWQDELSEEQVHDVVTYLTVLSDSVRRGEVVYKTNCVLCHGVKADGKGRASVLFNPPPADLAHSDKDEQYKESIIRHGGASMGRSGSMPAWGERLSDAEMKDLLAYLQKILVAPSGPPDDSKINGK
ncbi:MAG: c-type cytochrome [Acidobacteriia bacterium]|nr:c-type cytochrome [Terriglobia bacterium]